MNVDIKTKDLVLPEYIESMFQNILDTIAAIIQAPSALIMRVQPPYIEVFASSNSVGNPYKVGDKDHLTGLYCETVLKTKNELLIPNALKDPNWDHNPDIKLGMISYLGYPLKWPDGELFGTICVLDSKENSYNVLYRKLLNQFKTSVEHILSNILVTNKLKKANTNLATMNNELEAFNRAVSHDLRNPLSSLLGYIDILTEDHSNQLDSDGLECIQNISSLTVHMSQMVTSLLNLSMISNTELIHEEIDFSEMVRKLIKEFQIKEPERSISAIIEDGVTAEGDKTLLKNVLQNLLSNAWKFTKKRRNTKIEFGTIKNESEKIYYVRDNGAGFDQARVENLFSVFTRLHSSNEFEGTGIGLSTVQKIIQIHGGRIWAEGETGKGAIFYFTLSKQY